MTVRCRRGGSTTSSRISLSASPASLQQSAASRVSSPTSACPQSRRCRRRAAATASRSSCLLALCGASALLLSSSAIGGADAFIAGHDQKPYHQHHKNGQDPSSRFKVHHVREAEDIMFGKDASQFKPSQRHEECGHINDIMWVSETGASVYQAPLIADLHSDGKKEVIAPTFVQYVEVIDGLTGDSVQGWPYTHQSLTTHSSALLVDVNQDGNNEILLATSTGELLFFTEGGVSLANRTLKIPHATMPRLWYAAGGDAAANDRVAADDLRVAQEARIKELRAKGRLWGFEQVLHELDKHHAQLDPKVFDEYKQKLVNNYHNFHAAGGTEEQAGHLHKVNSDIIAEVKKIAAKHPTATEVPPGQHRATQAPPTRDAQGKAAHVNVATQSPAPTQPPVQQNAQQQQQQNVQQQQQQQQNAQHVQQQQHQGSVQSAASRHLLEEHLDAYHGNLDSYAEYEYDGAAPSVKTAAGTQGWYSDEATAAMSFLYHPLNERSKRVLEEDPLDQTRFVAYDPAMAKVDEVYVPPHVLDTPVIADLDLDGTPEIIMTVSYYYDKSTGQADGLGANVDPDNYVGGGLVVMSFNGTIIWSKALDRTTNKVLHPAYIYSSPTVVDLDGSDSPLEIIVTTSQGFIYAFGHDGELRRNFPIVMADIQGQAVCEDLDNDGALEICVADMRSNVACFTRTGQSFWESRVSGYSAATPRIGDINGDGKLELVLGTSTGHIWALDGLSGRPLEGFPVKAKGTIHAPVLLVSLHPTEEGPQGILKPKGMQGVESEGFRGLHIVVPAHDGHLYIIDGKSLCVSKVDIGEHVYAQVLADDLDGNGNLDLVVATMNGNIYALQTKAPYHPLKAWTSGVQGLNGMTAKEGNVGVYALQSSRVHRDVVGSYFKVMFEIVDHRGESHRPGHHGDGRRYEVEIFVGKELKLFSRQYYKAGVHAEIIRTPATRMYGTVYIVMRTETSRQYVDAFSLSFNMYFFSTIKWVVLIPFAAIGFTMLYMKPVELDTYLPTYGMATAHTAAYDPMYLDDWEDENTSDEDLYEEAFRDGLDRGADPPPEEGAARQPAY
eukprot:Rhum_TRINITY_DN14386_c7_g1::Rhum_TRINITY_DN14386_c7_g1_i1::g.84049::m.84049